MERKFDFDSVNESFGEQIDKSSIKTPEEPNLLEVICRSSREPDFTEIEEGKKVDVWYFKSAIGMRNVPKIFKFSFGSSVYGIGFSEDHDLYLVTKRRNVSGNRIPVFWSRKNFYSLFSMFINEDRIKSDLQEFDRIVEEKVRSEFGSVRLSESFQNQIENTSVEDIQKRTDLDISFEDFLLQLLKEGGEEKYENIFLPEPVKVINGVEWYDKKTCICSFMLNLIFTGFGIYHDDDTCKEVLCLIAQELQKNDEGLIRITEDDDELPTKFYVTFGKQLQKSVYNKVRKFFGFSVPRRKILKESFDNQISGTTSDTIKSKSENSEVSFVLDEHKLGEFLYNQFDDYTIKDNFSIYKDEDGRKLCIRARNLIPFVNIPIDKIQNWKYTERITYPEKHHNEIIQGYELQIFEKYEKTGEKYNEYDVVAPSGRFAIVLRELEKSYDLERKDYKRDINGKFQKIITNEHRFTGLDGWMTFKWNEIPFEYKMEIVERLKEIVDF